ncbi:hypothetical protein AMTRI_Chr01g132020 [Amborella trichopoda]
MKVEFNKPNNSYSSKPIPTVRKLTPAEARERREKGLCYHCDEKFTPNHKCKTQKLFWVEGLLEDEDEEEVVDSATVEVQEVGLGEAQEDDVALEISLHAITGARAPQTMRIIGKLRHCQLTILIDSGSTHNLIDPFLIKKANLPTQLDGVFEVMVANGKRLEGSGRCRCLSSHKEFQ